MTLHRLTHTSYPSHLSHAILACLIMMALLAGHSAPRSACAQTLPPRSPISPLADAQHLRTAFTHWHENYQRSGGERNYVVGLGWMRGLTADFPRAVGRATFDLVTGTVDVEVRGLPEQDSFEVWLVDNQTGPRRSVMPEAGDRLVNLGKLEFDGGVAKLHTQLDDEVRRDFQLDLVVVARAGTTPVDSGVLFGAPSLFQGLYTGKRLDWPAGSVRGSKRSGPAHAAGTTRRMASLDALVCRGEDLFFREQFNGNGRTCGTCHPAENNLTIDPEFIATLPDNDPLFVAEFIPALSENFENPRLMRELGLILENLDGFDDLENKFVMRGVPHTLGLSTLLNPGVGDGTTVPPVQRTGWSGDGAPGDGSLHLFAVGAVVQHFPRTLGRVPGVDFRLPTDEELDALEAFQLSLGRQEELDLNQLSLRGAVPARGKELFLTDAKCNLCHANAGANASFAPSPQNFNFNTGVENLPNQPADLIDPTNNPPDGGFRVDPNPSGGFGNGTFNTPVLVEAADTGPFFHNNAIRTIEGAVEFYDSETFNNSPAGVVAGGIELDPTDVEAVAAFLRVINALENIRQSLDLEQRARELTQKTPMACRPFFFWCADCAHCATPEDGQARELLELSVAELSDAVDVLRGGGLHPAAVAQLNEAITLDRAAAGTACPTRRICLIDQAKKKKLAARADLLVVDPT